MSSIRKLISFLILYSVFGGLYSRQPENPSIIIAPGNGRTTTTQVPNQDHSLPTLPTVIGDNETVYENSSKPIFPCDPKKCSPESETDLAYCPEDKGDTTFGWVEFPRTQATAVGTNVVQPCPSGFRDDGAQPIFEASGDFSSIAQREAMSGLPRVCRLENIQIFGRDAKIAKWDPPDIESVEPMYCRTRTAAVHAVDFDFLAQASSASANSFRQSHATMTALVHRAKDDYALAVAYLESMSEILENEVVEPYLLKGFMDLIQEYANIVDLKPGYKIRINTSTILFETAIFPEDTEELIKSNYSYYTPNFHNSSLMISVPLEMVQMANEQNVPSKLLITAYNSKVYSLWNGENSSHLWNDTDEISLKSEDAFTGSYRIISAQLLDAQITNLTDPFIYKLSVHTPDGYKWVCVYWNETDRTWIQDGIETVVLQDEIQCESSHLTAFSAILDPIPGSSFSPITPEHTRILGILSSLGSALSIAGLFMTTLTYGLFRCLRRDRSNRVLFHLCLSLLLLHLMSVTSERYLWDSKCFLPAYLLHFFLLTSLCWMLIEALHMFQLLISVFVKPEAHFLIKRAAFAWGCPLILVSICAAVHPEVYYEGRDNLCIIAAELNLPLYYTAYLGPAVLILATNFFIFCRIASVLYKQGIRSRKQKMMSSNLNKTGPMDWKNVKKSRAVSISPTQIKGALTVMILVGVGWVFALFAIGPFQLFFKYLFVICNAGQGVFIFVFRVILHPVASRTWNKVLFGIHPDLESSTSSSLRLHDKRQSMQSLSAYPTFISASSSAENTLTASDPMSAKLASNLTSILRQSASSNSDLSQV